MALTKIDDRGLKTPIDLLDNEKIRVGTGNDLEVFHDGSNSYIKNITGELKLIAPASSAVRIRNHDDSANVAVFNIDGATHLYYDSAHKFSTTSTGVTVVGDLTTSGNVTFADSSGGANNRAVFGAGGDLNIYHNGTSSLIEADDLRLRNAAGDENFIICTDDGAVELYHNNSKKLETHGNGTQLTGNLGIGIAPNTDVELHISHDGSATLPTFGAGTKAVISGTANNSAYIALDILGGNSTGASIINFGDADDEDAGEIFYFHSDNSMSFRTNSSSDNKLQITSGGLVKVPDNGKFVAGTGDDLQIYHDGSHSRIDDTGTGSLVLRTSNFLVEKYGGDYMINGVSDGAVELYYDNSKKFETTSAGATLTGALTTTQLNVTNGLSANLTTSGYDIKLGDSTSGIAFRNRVRFGNGEDMTIFHSGTHSYIQNTTGNLLIESGSSISFRDNTGSVDFAKMTNGTGVDLYYDNSKKFETTANGVNITGSLWTDGIYMDDSQKIHLGTSGVDLQLYHDGSSSYITNATGSLYLKSTSFIDLRGGGDETMIKGIVDGAVELYYNNSKKFETNSAGVTVFGSEGLKLYTENGNNTDTNSIVWRGGSDSQQANVAQLVAKQVSDWGGELQLKVKKNDGGLSDNYAMVLHAKGDSGGHINLCQDSVARFQVNGSGFKAGASIPGNHETGGMIVNSGGESSLYRSSNGIVFIIGGPQSGQKLVEFRHTSTGIGNISKSGTTAITFNTTNSDRTLKKNFEDWTDSYWTGFKDLKPQKFNFLFQEDSDPKLKGYIAQDLASTFPEAYPKDAETDKYMFNPSGMVPYLMKTLQEAIVEIETLKTKVAALESS